MKIEDYQTDEILRQNIAFMSDLSRDELIALNRHMWTRYSEYDLVARDSGQSS